MNKIVNLLDKPLENVAVKELISQSSMINNKVGVCPTCGNTMSISSIYNGEKVYYCTADRVTLPLSNGAPNV